MTKVSNQTVARHYDVLVIGAGISGLHCASRLYKHKYFRNPGRLLVLEARHRIGGRIESVVVEGSRLDTGANWIHGIGTEEHPNPLMELMAKRRYRPLSGMVAFKALDSSTDTGHATNASSSTDDASQVIDSHVAGIITGNLFETLDCLYKGATEMTQEQAKEKQIFQAILDIDSFRETFQSLPKEYHTTYGSLFQFVENMEAGPLVERSVERPEGKPCMSMLEYAVESFSGDQVFVLDGYATVLDELAKDLVTAGLIKLNTEVTKIDWTSSPIRIQAGHGSYTADTVVCTLPLGVLKDGKPDAFTPALPSDKEEAIQKLGFGTLDKVFLVFDQPWWTQEPYLSIVKKGHVKPPLSTGSHADMPDMLMGFTEELPGYCINEDGTISSAPCDVSVINLSNLTGFPVLQCFVSCSTAVRVEEMTNEQAGGIMHRALDAWFGQQTPKPIAVHVTRWASDPYSKGSYSHMITGVSEAAHRVSFQNPITNKDGATLRFAGEHTSRDHYAVAHGAYISGEREASAILKQMSLE